MNRGCFSVAAGMVEVIWVFCDGEFWRSILGNVWGMWRSNVHRNGSGLSPYDRGERGEGQ